MKTIKIKVKNSNSDYSIIIGRDILKMIPDQIRLTCPEVKKIGLIIDKKIPKKFVNKLKDVPDIQMCGIWNNTWNYSHV